MWHEARKQERKIRGIMVDYKKRAERRRDFYEKIKADPTQFLQLHGRPVKIHLDPAVALAGDSPANMMPWQGHPDVLIDRFDVRAHLDYIRDNSPHTDSATNEELSREDRLVNYERYRIIVQNDFLGIGEEKFLHQLYLEEQFGPVTRTNEIDKRKRDKGTSSGAAIPYSYDDNTSGQGPTEEEEVEGEEEKEDEEEEDDSDVDFDLCVDVTQVGPQQAHEMNMCGAAYGMSGNDFYTFLTRDIEEKESLRQAREQEEEKAMYSGRKSRRERRAFREKRLQGRKISPPSYAARTSPTYDPYRKSQSKSRSRSRSHSPVNSGQITYITSFGGEEESTDEGGRLPSSKFLSSSSSHSANVVVAPQTKASRSRSPRSRSSGRSRSSRGWDNSISSPHRGRGSSKSSSQRWSPDNPSRRSRAGDHGSSSRKARSKSPHHTGNRSGSHTRPRRRRSNSSKSSSRSRSPITRLRARSRSKTPHNQPPPPPIRRYYGSRKGDSSSSELGESDSDSAKQSSSPLPRNSKPPPHKNMSTGFGNSGAGTKSQPKLTPQERLKKKMQALLNRQYKADKRAERMRHEKQEQERQDREDELREMAIKLRRRERERRHRMQDDDDDDDDEEYDAEERGSSPSSQSGGSSPSPSPPPPPTPNKSGTSGHRRNRWDRADEEVSRGDHRGRRGRSTERQDRHSRSRSRSPPQRSRRQRPLVDY
ncbi:CLK4-associating serine/arginine rich protein [Cryptotermes secundus]|uniref:CLK4-associating serine/arginine rich protein n=1 Tax=Cryptotermes secundus TaxID=105785 RepID=A0A2J7Q8V2_9NEOP|nr:CLK4-associating serine/arginine rich protein isoform X1 [Cryptotermes secundus]PNF25018.1 CLK4-associating serine/arginine rich protein [Cryptotermes secundus]